MESGGFVPAHRLVRKTTPLARVTVKPAPKGLKTSEIFESAFTKLARLEAA